jgi:hypothetical protein
MIIGLHYGKQWKEIYINIDNILCFEKYEEGSKLCEIERSNFILVRETPAQIMELIKQAKEA